MSGVFSPPLCVVCAVCSCGSAAAASAAVAPPHTHTPPLAVGRSARVRAICGGRRPAGGHRPSVIDNHPPVVALDPDGNNSKQNQRTDGAKERNQVTGVSLCGGPGHRGVRCFGTTRPCVPTTPTGNVDPRVRVPACGHLRHTKNNPTSESKRKNSKESKVHGGGSHRCGCVSGHTMGERRLAFGRISPLHLLARHGGLCSPLRCGVCVCVRLWLPVGCARITAPSGVNSGVTSGYHHCL